MYRDELLVDYLLATARVEPLQIVSGVYFLFEDEEIVYIGQSCDVFVRVRTHFKDPRMIFDKWAFIKVEEDRLAEVEREYIRMFQPYLNTVGIKFYGSRKRRNNRVKERFIVHESGLYRSIEPTEEDHRHCTDLLDKILRPNESVHIECTHDSISNHSEPANSSHNSDKTP
jgi:hypothetical protein